MTMAREAARLTPGKEEKDQEETRTAQKKDAAPREKENIDLVFDRVATRRDIAAEPNIRTLKYRSRAWLH